MLQEKAKLGELQLSPQIKLGVQAIIEDGIEKLSSFHVAKPLYFTKKGTIASKSIKVLFFYHNRMANYKLKDLIDWNKEVLADMSPAMVNE